MAIWKALIFSTYRPIKDWKDQNLKTAFGKHAWYEDDEPLKPWEGLTRPKYTGLG